MDNIETVAALGLESKQKYCLLRSSSETSFSEKCLEPNNDLSVCYLEGPLSNERSCSTESVVVPCSEGQCYSHSSSTDTLTDKLGQASSSSALTRGVKSLRLAVSRGASLEDSLSPMTKPLSSHESFTSLQSVVTTLSAEGTLGKFFVFQFGNLSFI